MRSAGWNVARFTCPKCNSINDVDPPNGEQWWDSNVEEFNCLECDALLYVSVRVEITLTAELNTDEPEVGDAS